MGQLPKFNTENEDLKLRLFEFIAASDHFLAKRLFKVFKKPFYHGVVIYNFILKYCKAV